MESGPRCPCSPGKRFGAELTVARWPDTTLPARVKREQRHARGALGRRDTVAERDGESIEYIEATAEDVAVANRLAARVLGRSLDDVPPHTRRLLRLIDSYLRARSKREGTRFTLRQLREWCHWGNTQLKVHLHRLVDLEFLLAHGGGRGRQVTYELLWDGQACEPTISGLVDVGVVGDWSAGGRPGTIAEKANEQDAVGANRSGSPVHAQGGR